MTGCLSLLRQLSTLAAETVGMNQRLNNSILLADTCNKVVYIQSKVAATEIQNFFNKPDQHNSSGRAERLVHII